MDKNTKPEYKQSLVENWLSLFGFMLAVIFLAGELILITIDLTTGHTNPYVGILIYIVGPSILILGLLLVPLGMWRIHRKRQRGWEEKRLPIFDLNNTRHRLYLFVFTGMTTIFLILSMVGTYQAYHITESNAFCGLLCHQVMEPEFTRYQFSPHARVDCVQCHIGPGADWFVKSKLSGAWQVYAVMTNSYELPIDTPIENLRPARDTCEQCHWPEKFYESVEKKLVYYGSDEENTPYRVDLLLHVGENLIEKDKNRSIHWHIGLDHTLEYYATDEDRQEIPWVRVTYNDGTVDEFFDTENEDFNPDEIPEDEIRTMDCIDCHNRPSHRFLSPFEVINKAMLSGQLDVKIPDLKSTLSDLFLTEYQTTEEGLETIETELRDSYADYMEENPDQQKAIEQTIDISKTLFTQNFFPEWNANWSKHTWNIGHFEFPGCYRCHDDQHMTRDESKVISNDCNLCHSIVRQGEGWDELQNLEYKEQDFLHPRGFGDLWEGQNCHECHSPDNVM